MHGSVWLPSRGILDALRLINQPAMERLQRCSARCTGDRQAECQPSCLAGATKGLGAMFGIHVWPTLPSGMLASRAGPLLAASLIFEVTVKGSGGHAAMPHLTRDPIVAMAHAISAVQVLFRCSFL